MQYDMELIGKRIKAARRAKRYTQEYVSTRANIGVKFLSQIECGKAGLSVQTLLSLCTILEVNPNYILLSDITGQTDPISNLLKGLTPRQLQDAEEMLRIFVRNCKSESYSAARPLCPDTNSAKCPDIFVMIRHCRLIRRLFQRKVWQKSQIKNCASLVPVL